MTEFPQKTVLVVEDEILIRIDTAESLRDVGFEVVEAEDGDEALAIMEGRDDVALIVTDINMPGAIDGLELVRRVHKRNPRIGLIVTSGAMHITPSDLPPRGLFVSKPYAAHVVAMTARRLLA
jgi:CheY-like chemotaxis protein